MAAERPAKSGAVVRRTLGVMIIRGFDTVLSFAVAVLLAGRFGASAQLDAFFAARRATMGPTELLKQVITQIAMPNFTRAVDSGGEVRLANLPTNAKVTFGALIVVPMLLMFAPGPVLRVLMPGFAEERLAIASQTLTIMLPLIPIAVLSGLMLTILQARGVFMVGEATRMIQRLVLVLVLLTIPALTVVAISWVVLGAALASLALLFFVYWRWGRNARATSVATPEGEGRKQAEPPRKLPKGRVAAAMLMLLYFQASVMIDFAFVSTLATGSLSALEYGTRIVSLAPGLVMVSIGTVLYPNIVRLTDRADRTQVGNGVRMMVRASFFVQMPVSIGLFLVAPQIVALLFGQGGFDAEAQAETVLMVQYFAIASMFLTPNHVLMDSIYSDGKASPLRPVAIYAGFALAIRVALMFVMVPRFGLHGLGMAVVLSAMVNLSMAMTRYKSTNRDFKLKAMILDMIAIILVGITAAGLAWTLVLPQAAPGIVSLIVRGMALPAIAFGAAYILLAGLLRQPDLVGLISRMPMPFRRQPTAAE
tara:strand:- start:559 stop:2166 length:1608 start_codon:yes stop_codon:yes gene_type:complete